MTEPFPLEVVGIGPVPLGDGNFDIGSALTSTACSATSHPRCRPRSRPRDDEPTSS